MPNSSVNAPWKLDPEFSKATSAIYTARSVTPKTPASAINLRRQMFNATTKMLRYTRTTKLDPRVQVAQYEFPSSLDGTNIKIFHYFRSDIHKGGPLTAALLHCHGGGFMSGSVDILDEGVRLHVGVTGIPWFSVEFRLAPEHKYPTQIQDCFDGLKWLHAKTAEFNVDRRRIGVVGESSGGGLALGVAMLARDQALSPPLAKQILVYPMVDDRILTADPKVEPIASMTIEDIICGWTCMLDVPPGSDDVPIYAAPGRATSEDLVNLPPAYIEVGVIDTFRDSIIELVQKLLKAGVMTDFHLVNGQVHAAEFLAPETAISKRYLELRQQAMASF
ncbi:hypothetical protein Cpir12675_002003 [Ceratocystis pirilliformis]|uniref:Alpha/beta hydrolase fold-3 domain-containing protein n=1 Tax=Ceratocystis pirilliformis TaxID=259994 RepID=A0ABR3ZC86_9PEZI